MSLPKFSPEDTVTCVLAKCRHDARMGILKVFIPDPESKFAWPVAVRVLEIGISLAGF
jgi:hypothetical protein